MATSTVPRSLSNLNIGYLLPEKDTTLFSENETYVRQKYSRGWNLEEIKFVAKSQRGKVIVWNQNGELEKTILAPRINRGFEEGDWTYVQIPGTKSGFSRLEKQNGQLSLVVDFDPKERTKITLLKLNPDEAGRRDHARFLRDMADEEAYG